MEGLSPLDVAMGEKVLAELTKGLSERGLGDEGKALEIMKAALAAKQDAQL